MQTLKEARVERGIKQKSVADAINVTRQTYSKYEANPDKMPVAYARAACEFIGCDFGRIFFAK